MWLMTSARMAVILAKRWQRAWIEIVCGRLCCASKYGKVLQNMATVVIRNMATPFQQYKVWSSVEGYIVRVGGRQWQIGKKSASDISTMHYVTLCFHLSYTIYTHTHTQNSSYMWYQNTAKFTVFALYYTSALITKHCSEILVLYSHQLIYEARTHILCVHKYASGVKTMLQVKSTDVSGNLNPLVVDKCLIWPFSWSGWKLHFGRWVWTMKVQWPEEREAIMVGRWLFK